MDPDSPKALDDARQQFQALLGAQNAEAAFQRLFAAHPHILSRALPVRVASHHIRPLARPGRSEPDFIFFPDSDSDGLSSGVIELKRPSTKLLTQTRKNVILLSRDASTAVAQACAYAHEFERTLVNRFQRNIILGNDLYVFVIAGLSSELARQVRSSNTRGLAHLVPPGCQVIPYDELLRRYEASIPPHTIVLVPGVAPATQSIVDQLRQIAAETVTASRHRSNISDANMTYWSGIEDRWERLYAVGWFHRRVIERREWCVIGTNELALESPAHLDFPVYVQRLMRLIERSVEMHEIIDRVARTGLTRHGMREVIARMGLEKILTEAIERCQKSRSAITHFDQQDQRVDFMARIGMLHLYNADSGDHYYSIDPLLVEQLRG